MTSLDGRWPPIYDADGLTETIRGLVRARDFDARFWSLRDRDSVCQGDVVRLVAPLPFLDETGAAFASDEEFEHWLVIGNTCDFTRELSDCAHSQLVPLIDLGTAMSPADLQDARAYRAARKFYVPPWPGGAGHHFLADFTRPVAIDKRAFPSAVEVVARLEYPAWVLLHSCLVRFLCRDDGRFD